MSRFPSIAPIHTAVTSLVGSHIPSLIGVAEALPFFVTPAAVAADSPVLNQLVYWAPCSITQVRTSALWMYCRCFDLIASCARERYFSRFLIV